MYDVEYAEDVADDLRRLRAHDRRRILDRIEEQLAHEPMQKTRNRKPLAGLKPPWDQEEPVWELRVGSYRAFYEVDDIRQRVVVHAVRRKAPHQTTEDIL
jgi:mRNA-degrading endonuclease RelE of RelBE toxin-antitoxin system